MRETEGNRDRREDKNDRHEIGKATRENDPRGMAAVAIPGYVMLDFGFRTP